MRMPRYRSLPAFEGPESRVSWHLFGERDQLGTLNLLTEKTCLEALRLVEVGRIVNLDHPLDLPLNIFEKRRPYRHSIFEIMPGYLDEIIDGFAPQLSSQWDALRHVRSPWGFYGHTPDDEAARPGGPLGIDQVSRHGVVGRGVLLDLARHFEDLGVPIDPNVQREIPVSVLEEVADAQGTEIKVGDILLVRFGVDVLLREIAAGVRGASKSYASPGLAQDEETVEWIWDRHIAALCADNVAVEVTPPRSPTSRLHPTLIGSLGLAMGELFDLVELSAACADRRRYEFCFIAKPWNLPGGVGSPANAMAIL